MSSGDRDRDRNRDCEACVREGGTRDGDPEGVATRRFFRRPPGVFAREKFLSREGETVMIYRDGMLVKPGMNPREGEVVRC